MCAVNEGDGFSYPGDFHLDLVLPLKKKPSQSKLGNLPQTQVRSLCAEVGQLENAEKGYSKAWEGPQLHWKPGVTLKMHQCVTSQQILFSHHLIRKIL